MEIRNGEMEAGVKLNHSRKGKQNATIGLKSKVLNFILPWTA
jgi:hypothetical protein